MKSKKRPSGYVLIKGKILSKCMTDRSEIEVRAARFIHKKTGEIVNIPAVERRVIRRDGKCGSSKLVVLEDCSISDLIHGLESYRELSEKGQLDSCFE